MCFRFAEILHLFPSRRSAVRCGVPGDWEGTCLTSGLMERCFDLKKMYFVSLFSVSLSLTFFLYYFVRASPSAYIFFLYLSLFLSIFLLSFYFCIFSSFYGKYVLFIPSLMSLS